MSREISRNQYHLLKYFRKDKPPINSFGKSKIADCHYLVKCGYLDPVRKYERSDSVGSCTIPILISYATTPAGRAAIYSFRATFYKWWIPVIISVISLGVSVVTLLLKIFS